MDNEADRTQDEAATGGELDRIGGGTGATLGAAPGTIAGYAFGGPVGVAVGGALGGAVEENLAGTEEAGNINVQPQTSGYTGGYEEDPLRSEAQPTLQLPGTGYDADATESDPLTGQPSDQGNTTGRIGD
ncbi:MAG TPA: hypothetical protein VGE04_02505 [Chloroflexia bacterium]|jgi:hypothetical protein